MDAATWELGGSLPDGHVPPQVLYHQASGLIVGPGRAYDLETGATIELGEWDRRLAGHLLFSGPGDSRSFRYQYQIRSRTFRYDGEADWTRLDIDTPDLGPPGNDAIMVFDSANRRLLFVGDGDHGVWAHDTVTGEWIELMPTG